MKLDFPIDLFNIENPDAVMARSNSGMDMASTMSISFVGIAKDAAPYIDRNIQLAKAIGSKFKEYEIYIYENDSTDNTVDILLSHHMFSDGNINYDTEKRPDLAYIRDDSPDIDPYHYKRCVKLAEARNKYALRDYRNFDIVCVVDWDIKGGWWISGFFHAVGSLMYLPDAACVGAYGVLGDMTGKLELEKTDPNRRLMYDSFAFRDINAPEKTHISEVGRYNFIRRDIGNEPVEVKSNFGGISLYKGELFDYETYSAKHWSPETCHVDCDHVCLNRSLREKGHKIYMYSSLMASHSPHRFIND